MLYSNLYTQLTQFPAAAAPSKNKQNAPYISSHVVFPCTSIAKTRRPQRRRSKILPGSIDTERKRVKSLKNQIAASNRTHVQTRCCSIVTAASYCLFGMQRRLVPFACTRRVPNYCRIEREREGGIRVCMCVVEMMWSNECREQL